MSDQASSVISPNFEILIFAASTEEPPATAAATFGVNLENQRILHYKMMGPQVFATIANDPTRINRWYATMEFDIKVAARLAGQDIVLSTRCSESETADVQIGVRAQFSSYLTTP